MINKDYYPTPKELVIKMVSKIDSNLASRILEPSAGDGNIVEYLREKYPYRCIVDCIEIDEELQATLMGKGFNLIDTDFLTSNLTKQYDTIIMNPPFSNGAAHLLKAWDTMYNGDVISLLNAETIKNPYSKERKLLVDIIDQFGEVEYIENSFLDAERKTSVEVALIHLRKRQSIRSDYFDGMRISHEHEEPELNKQELVIPKSQIENSVLAYERAIECKKQSILKDIEFEYYANMIRKNNASKSDNEITQKSKETLNEYIDNLRESAWRDIMDMADFRRNITEKVMNEIDTQFEKVKKLEFTVSNIRRFLKNLIERQREIIDDCILEVFDNFTKYHPENRVHIEGWKSNDIFFVGRRVVLPRIINTWFSSGRVTLDYSAKQKIWDIEKVIKIVMGDKVSMVDEISKYNNLFGVKVETKYCDMRFYKKGTGHFYFDKKFIDRFNIMVGRRRGWLNKADDKIPKEFWLMNK